MANEQALAEEEFAEQELDHSDLPLVVRTVYRFEDALMATLLVAIFVIVLASVAARSVFHAPLSWSTEVSVTLMIWLTFIGLAIGIRDKAHVSFELLEDRFHGVARTGLQLVQSLIMGFLLVIIGYGGIGLVQLGVGQVTPAGFPQWVAFSALPVGCTLGILHLLAIEAQSLWAAAADRRSGTGEEAT